MVPIEEKIKLNPSQRSFNLFQLKKKKFRSFWHYHPELELTLITNGSGIRFIGDSIMPYRESDLVLIGPNLPHNWVSLNEKVIQSATVLQFPGSLFDQFPECDEFKTLFGLAANGIHFNKPSESIIDKIQALKPNLEVRQLIVFLEILNELNNDTNRTILSNISYPKKMDLDRNQSRIEKATSYILENLGNRLTVHEMADFTHLVSQSFCRWFKSETGNTFVIFLNTARITRASQYLITTEESIKEISYLCGFGSISHFNRLFKKLKGVSPSEYRAKKHI